MKPLPWLLLSSCFISSSFAGQWSGTVELETLYPQVEGLAFTTGYANKTLSSCDSGKRFFLNKNHPNYDVIASTIISAFYANKKVDFNIDDRSSPACQPSINRLIVIK